MAKELGEMAKVLLVLNTIGLKGKAKTAVVAHMLGESTPAQAQIATRVQNKRQKECMDAMLYLYGDRWRAFLAEHGGPILLYPHELEKLKKAHLN